MLPYRQKLLTSWLTLIPYLETSIKTHYQQDAMLMNACSENSEYQQVIKEISPLQKKLPIALYPTNQSDSLQGAILMSTSSSKHTNTVHVYIYTYIHIHIPQCIYIHIYIKTHGSESHGLRKKNYHGHNHKRCVYYKDIYT